MEYLDSSSSSSSSETFTYFTSPLLGPCITHEGFGLLCNAKLSNSQRAIAYNFSERILLSSLKYVQREIGKDPTKCLESNEVDPFRIGKDMTERKMPVFLDLPDVIKSVVQVKCNFFQRIRHIFGPTGLYVFKL